MQIDQAEIVGSLAELDAITERASGGAAGKTMHRIDQYARQFIELSPFCCLATNDGRGHADVTPRGDKPGFVRILDEKTLLIPERPGNNRMDSLRNIIEHPSVGLLFFIPVLGMAVGAGLGAIMGKITKSGVDKEFQDQVRGMIQPGTSALFLMVEKVTPDKAIDAMSKYGGTVLKTSLSKEGEADLQKALHGEEAH